MEQEKLNTEETVNGAESVRSDVKNPLPYCQCYDICSEQAEWSIVYGKSTTSDYAFACNKHIGELMSNIASGRHGKVVTFYAEHFTSKKSYDEKWNDEWERHTVNCC